MQKPWRRIRYCKVCQRWIWWTLTNLHWHLDDAFQRGVKLNQDRANEIARDIIRKEKDNGSEGSR